MKSMRAVGMTIKNMNLKSLFDMIYINYMRVNPLFSRMGFMIIKESWMLSDRIFVSGSRILLEFLGNFIVVIAHLLLIFTDLLF